MKYKLFFIVIIFTCISCRTRKEPVVKNKYEGFGLIINCDSPLSYLRLIGNYWKNDSLAKNGFRYAIAYNLITYNFKGINKDSISFYLGHPSEKNSLYGGGPKSEDWCYYFLDQRVVINDNPSLGLVGPIGYFLFRIDLEKGEVEYTSIGHIE